MKKANVIGKIIQMFPVREFKKENREGKIGSFILADNTGNVRTVLWDTNHIKLIESGDIKQEDVVEINNGNMRESELHLTGFSDIKKSSEILDNVKVEREFKSAKLNEIKIGQALKTRAFIVQAFEPRFFEVCPECSKRIVLGIDGGSCEEHGRVLPVRRAILNLVLDDGNDSIRAVLFSEQIEKLGVDVDKNFLEARENFLGNEMFFSGTIRQNKLFNNTELFVSEIEKIEIGDLVNELEKVNKSG